MNKEAQKYTRTYIASILVSLYSLQGLIIGLFLDTLQMQLKKTSSYVEVGTFLLCSYPFSFKVLWSPLVDTYSFRNYGRKKSWIIPCQLLAGCFIYYLGYTIDDHILNKNIGSITVIAFIVMFLIATQDIAVDSWGLVLCGKDNFTLASSCQTVGQLLGINMSTFGFIHLNQYNFITLSGYIKFISLAFVAATIFLFTIEESSEGDDHVNVIDNGKSSNTKHNEAIKPKKVLSDTIIKLKQMMTNKSFLHFISLTLISKVGDIFSNSIIDLVYLENGMSERFYASISAGASLLRMIFAYYCSSIKGNFLFLFIKCYKRIIYLYIGELSLLLYWLYNKTNETLLNEILFYIFFFILLLLKVFLFELSFSSLNGFFNKITDIQIGATYLTALCSANNLSEKWPGFFVFYLMDIIGFKLLGVLSIVYCIAFYYFTNESYCALDAKDEREWKLNQQQGEYKKD